MALDPQASYSSQARIVLPGLGGAFAETLTNTAPTTVTGYTYDMSRCRSFAVSQP